MPTVMTHAAVGIALGALAPFEGRPVFWALSAGLASLPDVDVVAFPLGVSHGSMCAHRGITHSLFAAAVTGVVVALLCSRTLSASPWPLAAYFAVVMASHGILDAFTNGGSGVAFLAPFDSTRYFFPWRPVEVSPLGLGFFSARGLRVLESEFLWIWLPAIVIVGGFKWALSFLPPGGR